MTRCLLCRYFFIECQKHIKQLRRLFGLTLWIGRALRDCKKADSIDDDEWSSETRQNQEEIYVLQPFNQLLHFFLLCVCEE